MTASTCRGCGRPIVWIETPDGKRIPLDPKPPVYRVTSDGRGERDRLCMVSHFATCPQASDFSASNRRGDAADGARPQAGSQQ